MSNIESAALHLEKRNYSRKILKPLPTISGELLYQDERGYYWRAYPFFDNTSTISTIRHTDQAFEAAYAYGELTSCLSDLDATRLHYSIPNFHNGLRRTRMFENALKSASENRIGQSIIEIQFIITHCKIFDEVARLELPLRVTHNDTKLSNLLFDRKEEKVVAVVDWDTIMPGIILSDFGDMIRTIASSAKEDETNLEEVFIRQDLYRAIKEGYMESWGGKLTTLEENNLAKGAKWIILMQAMRFLTDFLEDDIYYKTDYIGHNWVRARNQIALYQSIFWE